MNARVFAGVGPIVVGHRGGRGDDWPAENTMAAFSRAVDEGARAVELDVRTCASGEIVVFHDATLKRMTDDRDARKVADVSRADLERVSLRGDARVPTLDDVLTWAGERDVAVNVELKHDVSSRSSLARGVADVLASHPRTEVLLSSFDPRLVALMAALAPRVPRALLTHATQRHAPILHALATPATMFALHVERTQTSPRAIARWKRRGLRVGVWTVNDVSEARDLAALGVDFLITDHPGEMLAALGK